MKQLAEALKNTAEFAVQEWNDFIYGLGVRVCICELRAQAASSQAARRARGTRPSGRASVSLHKEAQWFVKGVGGVRKSDAGLKAVNVLNMLRQKAGQGDFKPIDSEPSPAVAGSDSQTSPDDDYDPMDAMVALDSVAEAVSDKKKKIPRNAKSTVLACKSCRFQPDLRASPPQVKGKPPSLCTHHPIGKNHSTYVQIVSPGFWRTQPTS